MRCTNPVQVKFLTKSQRYTYYRYYGEMRYLEFKRKVPYGYGKDYVLKGQERRDWKNYDWKQWDQLPCGKCLGCIMAKASEWAARLIMEASLYEKNYFITFTYSNDYLPKYNGYPTIRNKDIQDFIKRLRKKFTKDEKTKIRYFGSSEYGPKTMRPHYHYLFFNLDIPDLVDTKEKNKLGDVYYSSKIIEELWGKGMVVIGEVSYQSAGYVSRYTMKKAASYDFAAQVAKIGLEKETLRMSNGIGLKYFEKNVQDIYKNDKIVLSTKNGPLVITPPRYFDKKYKELVDEYTYQDMKDIRMSNAKVIQDLEFSEFEGYYQDYLDRKKEHYTDKLRVLKRRK